MLQRRVHKQDILEETERRCVWRGGIERERDLKFYGGVGGSTARKRRGGMEEKERVGEWVGDG